MTRRHQILRSPRHRLLTAILFAVFSTLQAAADDLGYPPPPGPYRSESRIPRPAQLPAEPAEADPIDGGTRAARGSAGLLPLPADTFSARDTADILFGSVPAQQTVQDSAPPSPTRSQTAVPGTAADDSDGWSMDFSQDKQAPAYTDPGIQDGRHRPYPAPAYPGYRQPSAPYYPAYQNQFDDQYGGLAPGDAYQAPYPRPEPYGMPPASAPEAAAPEIFRPAE